MASVVRRNGKHTERTARVTIPAGVVREINFDDTHPNMFYVANNANAILAFSVSATVSDSNYDMLVAGYAVKSFARLDGVNQVFIYNTAATVDATITLVSWEIDDLDPAALPQTQEVVGASGGGLLGTIDINSFMSSLPAGLNNIGDVDIASALPDGDNVVGRVKITDGTTVAEVDAKVEAMAVIDVAHSYTHRAATFSHYQRNAALAAAGTILAEIIVPATHEMHLKAIQGWIGGGRARIEVIEAPTLTTGATAGQVRCRNRIGTPPAGNVTIKTNPTTISAGTVLDDYEFGGGSGTASGDCVEDQIEWILKPGTTYLVRMTNDGTSTEFASLKLFWYEHPV